MNQLKVNLHQSIIVLFEQGWSKRKIALELKLDRGTVRKYLAQVESKPPTPHTGSLCKSGPPSLCDQWSQQIDLAWQTGFTVQRIYQDLVTDHQFAGSYFAVRRYVRRRFGVAEVPFRHMETAPGEEMQVDFGLGGWVCENGKRRRPHLFRCVLSHSRKGYSEAVWRQTTESFIRCLANAFLYFGDSCTTVVIDNFKAGIIKADWFDPQINPKLEKFARHYNTVILPKPAMPRHKGKVEAGVCGCGETHLKPLPALIFPFFEET